MSVEEEMQIPLKHLRYAAALYTRAHEAVRAFRVAESIDDHQAIADCISVEAAREAALDVLRATAIAFTKREDDLWEALLNHRSDLEGAIAMLRDGGGDHNPFIQAQIKVLERDHELVSQELERHEAEKTATKKEDPSHA